ncbi:MAG TPA: OmpH family outer membrane protein [Saprospiraceae bacterium]|nr:OmpH family outer membrane protein [Saprospiraceae bacterium]
MNQMTLKSTTRKLLFILSFAMLFSFSSQAQRIASVDINLILESMDDYQKAQEQLDQVASKWRQEIAQEYDKIKGMYNRYQSEQVLMSEDVRKQKEEEIMNKEKQVREMQKEKFGPEGDLFKKREELVRPIQDKVYEAIESYANEKGYDFIFDKGGATGILFANERYDKTSDLLKRLGVK